MAVLTNFVLYKQMFDLFFRLLSEGMGDITACGGIYTEISETIAFVIKHINPASLFTNVVANLLTHALEILGDAWKLVTDLFGGKWYDVGKLTGELTMMIID
jgi:hypothetical protein